VLKNPFMATCARPLAVLCALLSVCRLSGSAPEARLREAWDELARLNPNVARDGFAAVTAAQPAEREARFGLALASLNTQPRRAATLAAARREFTALRDENPRDDFGIGATYYLARLDQILDDPPNPVAAVAGYRALLAAHPGHPYAELAAPKLAILLLYDDVTPAIWELRLVELTALLPRLQSPEACRDTRLVLADALIKLQRDHARAYPLLVHCLEHNLIARMPRLNAVRLQAAESARQLGRESEAIAHYTRYVEQFPHDVKTPEVRRRLGELQQKAGP